MSHSLGAGYSSSGECKGCCLGGLCYVSNTLHMCTTLQQYYGISLLYEQGHTAEVLGMQLGLKQVMVDKTMFCTINLID